MIYDNLRLPTQKISAKIDIPEFVISGSEEKFLRFKDAPRVDIFTHSKFTRITKIVSVMKEFEFYGVREIFIWSERIMQTYLEFTRENLYEKKSECVKIEELRMDRVVKGKVCGRLSSKLGDIRRFKSEIKCRRPELTVISNDEIFIILNTNLRRTFGIKSCRPLSFDLLGNFKEMDENTALRLS